MNVARPASTTAPDATPGLSRLGASSEPVSIGSVFSIAASILRCGTQFIRITRGYRSAAVAPGGPNIGDDRCDLVVGQTLREGRHAIRPGVALGTRRETSVQYHAHRVHRGV